MKRNSLTTALLAGLAGAAGLASSAHALNLNPDGLGQVLVFPYYTVNKGNQTLVSVVNTSNQVKAVKVRFLEGRNSREVLDFNLYLSPYDVWTGAISAAAATGAATLSTGDTSCTVPRITGSVPFRSFQYTGGNRDYAAGATAATPASLQAILGSIERTREGHIEMIEMGNLTGGDGSTQLAEEATHDQSTGRPDNCGALVAAWSPGGGWAANGAADITVPTGGLYGAGTIVDVANGTLHAYNADAIEGFYTNSAQPGNLHRNPGTIQPDLGDADNGAGSISVNIFSGNGTLTTQTVPARQRTRTTNLPYSFDAVSLLYMHDAIYNEYVTEASIGASSEWVVTFPTKRAYVDNTGSVVRAPFTDPFFNDGAACEVVDVTVFNREEATVIGSVDFSPPPPTSGAAFCYEAQVVTFNQSQVGAGQPSSIFGSTYASNIPSPFTIGWAEVTFDNPFQGGFQNVLNNAINSAGGLSFVGLPVTGFWSASYTNRNVTPGVLANYSGAYRHRASRVTVAPTIP